MAKGMRVAVYMNALYGGCSNGGVSESHKQVTLVGDGIPEMFDADESAPLVELRTRCGNLIAVPVGVDTAGKNGPMFGGAFVWCSDSRFRRVSQAPIPLHDRFEIPSAH